MDDDDWVVVDDDDWVVLDVPDGNSEGELIIRESADCLCRLALMRNICILRITSPQIR